MCYPPASRDVPRGRWAPDLTERLRVAFGTGDSAPGAPAIEAETSKRASSATHHDIMFYVTLFFDLGHSLTKNGQALRGLPAATGTASPQWRAELRQQTRLPIRQVPQSTKRGSVGGKRLLPRARQPVFLANLSSCAGMSGRSHARGPSDPANPQDAPSARGRRLCPYPILNERINRVSGVPERRALRLHSRR